MRVLGVLYVTDHRAHVGVAKRNLIVRQEGGWTRVPVETLEAVVLFGGQVSSEALALCVERGIRVAALRRSGRIRFVVGGATKGNVLLRVAQVRHVLDISRTACIARAVVAAKLQSYRSLLQRWSWDAEQPERSMLEGQAAAICDRIAALAGAEDGDKIRGIEGDGTRRYFKGLTAHLADHAGIGYFLGRSRRPPRDPVNALLSFLYGLALTDVVGGLETVGLDPQVGFLHGCRPGRPSLGLDVLEEFRPVLADRLAVRLVRRREIRSDHFVRTGAGACYLSDEGRRRVLEAYESHKEEQLLHPLLARPVETWALPAIQATLLARHLRGDLDQYPPFVLRS